MQTPSSFNHDAILLANDPGASTRASIANPEGRQKALVVVGTVTAFSYSATGNLLRE